MKIKEQYYYFIKDEFFEIVKDKELMQNKENGTKRSWYYCFMSRENDKLFFNKSKIK